jgi:hypothetical protein
LGGVPLTVPCAGLVAMAKARVSPEVPGVPVRVIAMAVFLLVLKLWLLATGGGGAAATVILTVAVLDTTPFSVASKVKLSGPR